MIGSTSNITSESTRHRNGGSGGGDGFVTKVDTTYGSTLWSMYLGGVNYDYASAIAVDGNGDAWVTGYTASYPVYPPTSNWMEGGFDTIPNGGNDAFVAKLDTDGGLDWSSYLGGNVYEGGTGIAIDGGGNAWVTGFTTSPNWAEGGFDTSQNGGYDGYVARINADGSLGWTSYLGGTGWDGGQAIAIDNGGNAWVAGKSNSPTFTSGGNAIGGYSGYNDIFVAKIKTDVATPASVSIVANASTVLEGNMVTYTITRTGDTSMDLAIALDDSASTAVAGHDYSSLTDVTIQAGNNSATFSVTMFADDAYDFGEILSISLLPSTDYLLETSLSVTTIQDASAGPVFLDSEVVSGFSPSEVVVGEYATTTFRVHLHELDSQDQLIPASSVTTQTYTLDAGSGATISQVMDTRGLSWTISGPTATLEVTGPYIGTAFDITAAFSFSSPGNKEVTLDSEVQFAAGGVPMSRSSKKSSPGRGIVPHPTPGAVEVPINIYHLLDYKAVNNAAHSAVLIPAVNGVMYYSYSTDGAVSTMLYNNIDDALAMAKAAGYTHYQYWTGIDQNKAAAARNAAMTFNNTAWDYSNRNCWHMILEALKAAQTNVDGNATLPVHAYNKNITRADESGKL